MGLSLFFRRLPFNSSYGFINYIYGKSVLGKGRSFCSEIFMAWSVCLLFFGVIFSAQRARKRDSPGHLQRQPRGWPFQPGCGAYPSCGRQGKWQLGPESTPEPRPPKLSQGRLCSSDKNQHRCLRNRRCFPACGLNYHRHYIRLTLGYALESLGLSWEVCIFTLMFHVGKLRLGKVKEFLKVNATIK